MTAIVGFAAAYVAGLPASRNPADFDGDGRSDWALVRAGGPSAPLSWYVQNASGVTSFSWGIGTDVVLSGDWDGDGKSDATVWRSGSTSTFYILKSTGGVLATPFGAIGDDPSVVADYDGDGRTDYAVYRQGASAGSQSYWWIRRSLDDGIVAQAWGSRGDTVAPGDYDGDGKADIAVRRAAGGLGVFYVLKSSGGSIVFQWGLDSDVIAPGDYDGDGRTDFAVVRDVGGQIVWYISESSTGAFRAGAFGLSSVDVPAPGDYDGDGKTDFAVWRRSYTPGASGFWVLRSSGGTAFWSFGTTGDMAIASAGVHPSSPASGAVIFNDDFGAKALFPATNWWNQDVSQAPLDVASDAFINYIGPTRGLHPDFGPPPYGIPYFSVGGSQPRVPITWILYGHQSDNGFGGEIGYPIPIEARTQAGYIEGNVPGGGGSGDRHMLIVDRDRRVLFELYATRWSTTNQRWEADSGAVFDLSTNGRRPEGWTSADAAGLAILPGLVRYEEAMSGREIKHAFRFTVRATNGYVWPASHVAGSTAGALPMGARLRLKASKDISGYAPYIQRIFQAMKTYGLIVADNGSDMVIQGAMDSRWNNDVLNPAFSSLKASDFEVVQRGWQ
jgi:hypothetical protein